MEISPFSAQNRLFWGARGGPRNFFFIGIFIFLLLRSPCKKLKSYDKPLYGFEQRHQQQDKKKKINLPKIVAYGTFRRKSSYFCFLGAHATFQNCRTNSSGRNGPFRLLSAQNRGLGGVPEFFFDWNLHIFVS